MHSAGIGSCSGTVIAGLTNPFVAHRPSIPADNRNRSAASYGPVFAAGSKGLREMPGSLRIAIVGGGIGGLTAALALRARGLDVTVFEQAEVLREIGAGVSIHPNAARLLKRIGLDDQLRKIGSPISGITLRTSQGEAITTSAGPATPCVFARRWSGLQRSSRRLPEPAVCRTAERNSQSRSPVHPASRKTAIGSIFRSRTALLRKPTS